MTDIPEPPSPCQTNAALAHLLLRLTLGIAFFCYGIGKFKVGVGKFVEGMVPGFEKTWLPLIMVKPFAAALPFVELTIGILLLLGLFTRWTLVLCGLLMAALTMGVAIKGDAETAGRNLIYALVVFVLLMFNDHNRYSADSALSGQCC